jgi:holo-[acyl-carrier protein] synthase
MNKLSVGNDIVENYRIREALEKFGERFLKRVFTSMEREYCFSKKDPIPFLAARFACKEAFIKAMCLGKGEILEFSEIELYGKEFGKKEIVLHGKAKELFTNSGYERISVSISHSEDYATAIVILYGG